MTPLPEFIWFIYELRGSGLENAVCHRRSFVLSLDCLYLVRPIVRDMIADLALLAYGPSAVRIVKAQKYATQWAQWRHNECRRLSSEYDIQVETSLDIRIADTNRDQRSGCMEPHSKRLIVLRRAELIYGFKPAKFRACGFENHKSFGITLPAEAWVTVIWIFRR